MPPLHPNLAYPEQHYIIKSGNMGYNSYFANVVTRLVFLLGTFILLSYLLVNTDRFFSILFISLLAVIQTISLVYFLNKTNRNLARFLLLLTQEDTSVITWKDHVEKTFQGLHHSFKKVNEEINRIRLEKEKGTILLQNVIDHITTGIFATDESGKVEIVNTKALIISGLNQLIKISDLDQIRKGTAEVLMNLRFDTGNILHIRNDEGEDVPVLVRVSKFMLGEKNLRLYSLQGIKNELEANEIESWQKMTRVLAHEISNSVTPISTLGAGIHRKLSQAERDKNGRMQLTKSVAEDLLQSADLIEKRSNALVDFMEHYKNFTRLPEPVPEELSVSTFFESLKLYFSDDLSRKQIDFRYRIDDPEIHLRADRALLEQAFINLIRNSLEALESQENGKITLDASCANGKVVLRQSDNGPGIPADIQSQIFIPFFTTKPGGTGIGMSIVRKIIILSGGSIRFNSIPGKGTEFIILLPG
jgi:two-component system, NtrC family, nitrogen regulation sensor histidine kinase NtrY